MAGSPRAIACYGKLPFYPEYLRLGLDSPGARAVVDWIDATHAALSSGRHGPAGTGIVRFAMRGGDGPGLVAGVVRQSVDAGHRSHPICLFVEAHPARVEARSHLLPLACDATWDALRERLERPIGTMADLHEVLATAPPEVDLSTAEAAYEAWLARPVPDGPWSALAQASGDDARNVAANFLAVVEGQRDARDATEGVTFVASLPPAEAGHHAAAWLDLFAAAAGGTAPHTLALFGSVETSLRLCALYRPAEGADLAAVLGRLDTAPLDDLNAVWGVDVPMAGVDALVAGGPASLAELRARVRNGP